MVDTPLNIPYSVKDPDTVLAAVKQQLPIISNGNWTNLTEADPGYMIVKAFVALFDANNFYTDSNLAESFLSTCQLRESAVRLAKMLNYTPARAQASTCTVRMTVPAFSAEVTFPTNTVWTVNGITFTCMNPIVIPLGQTAVNITLTQGTPYSVSVTGTGDEWFKISVPDNISNMVVTVNGVEWTEIDSFIGATNPQSYKVYEDSSGQTICFGANISTYAPNNGDTIVVTGVLTDGAEGNIYESQLAATLATTVYNNLDVNVTSSVVGLTTSSALGGLDVEDIDTIRQNAPLFYATQNRAVTVFDYKAMILNVPGVVSCSVVGGENLIPPKLSYVVCTLTGTNPYDVDPDLIESVEAALAGKNVVGIRPIIQAPNIIEMQLTVSIGVNQTIYSSTSVAVNAVNGVLSTFFAALPVGGNYYGSQLVDQIMNLGGLVYCDITFTLDAFANSKAGKITIELPSNVDLTNSVLTNSDGAVLKSGNLSSYLTGNNFVYQVPSTSFSDQKCTLTFGIASQSDDILVQNDQILVLTSTNIVPTVIAS